MTAILKTNDTQLRAFNGAEITEIEPLDEKLYAKDETGPMFRGHVARFGKTHLFADEIVEQA